MLRRLLLGGIPLVVGAALFTPAPAAAGGIILITHGDTITHVGNVPNDRKPLVRVATKGTDAEVGFAYSYFGVFWLDLWTWGGKYCLYKDRTVWELTPQEAAFLLNKPESELGKPFLYTFPLGLVILCGIVAVAVPVALLAKKPEAKVKELFEDPRYQRALNTFSEHAKKEEEARKAQEQHVAAGEPPPPAPQPEGNPSFEAAVQSLMLEGVPRTEAEKNLALLLHVLAQAHAQREAAGGQAEGAAPSVH